MCRGVDLIDKNVRVRFFRAGKLIVIVSVEVNSIFTF